MSFDVLEWMGSLSKDTKGQPQFAARLAERIERVTETMRDLADKGARDVTGKVTIEFTFEMAGNQVAISPKISSKEPAESLSSSTSFFGPDGRLCDIDPRQLHMEFRGTGGGLSPDIKSPGGGGAAKGTGGGGDIKAPDR